MDSRVGIAAVLLSASMACADPPVDAVCGDETREGAEVCDGFDLGGKQCGDVPGYVEGVLVCASDCAGYDTRECTADPKSAIVRINEITSKGIDEGEYAGGGDAVELVNIGQVAADLSGFELSDDPGFAADKTYVFPSGAMLAPGAFVVLVRIDEVTGIGDHPFGISSTSFQQLRLADASGALLDGADFEGADATISWCRAPDGDGPWQTCARTFGLANMAGGSSETGGTAVCGDDTRDDGESCDGADLGGMTCTDVSPSLGGGVLACNAGCGFDTSGCELSGDVAIVLNEIASSGDDEIELFNGGTQPVDLSGWILTDELSSPDAPYDPADDADKLEFAAGTTLAPGGWLVIVKGPPPGHLFGLSATGESIGLLDPAGVVIDFTTYAADQAETSWCRIPNGPSGVWQAGCAPSFGSSNVP